MNQGKTGDEYLYDTYALVEIIKDNKNYRNYAGYKVNILMYNLIELYYNLLRDYGEDTAKKYFFALKSNTLNIPDEVIFEAMKFKKENPKKNLSYVDCLGYIYAKKKGLKFLTGDNAFKGMKNVEYVK